MLHPSTPSLPSLKNLPVVALFEGLLGYAYGRINHKNPRLLASIFVIRALALTLFYQFLNFIIFREKKSLGSQKIFFFTSLIVNSVFFIALKELELIGKIFSGLLGLVIMGHFIFRIHYIQEQEDRLLT